LQATGTTAGAVVVGVDGGASPTTTVALPRHGVGGVGELGGEGEGIMLLEGLAGEEHRIEVWQAEAVSTGGSKLRERVLEGLVLRPETNDDVVDQFIIRDGRPHLGHGIHETLHLMKVGGG
jgi:hypothetical protein